jgi:phosphoribosylformimino-5-aminoimidazole carboxamide ribotide isomerase
VELIPAIDLLGGRVVRLAQGAFDAMTAYGDDPVTMARNWETLGARRIHLVDLDGARHGHPMQAEVVARVVRSVSVPCQVAGGIRGAEQVQAQLDTGADRVVLGSALIEDPTLAARLVERHGPERIVAALDVRDGRALGDGWVAGARGTDAIALARRLAESGVRWFAVTAIRRDGGMEGPDLELLARVRSAVPEARLIASGGIGSLEDVGTLADEGYAAAIVGRALYEGAFSLPEALAAAAGEARPAPGTSLGPTCWEHARSAVGSGHGDGTNVSEEHDRDLDDLYGS